MPSINEDQKALIAALREHGVDYLSPTDAQSDHHLDDESLIARLASHPEARFRQALIALILLKPQLAPHVSRLRDRIAKLAAEELVAHYMAAVYLQRMWRVRLGYYLSPIIDLPDYFSGELSLPDPNEGHGKVGLHVLAEWHANRSPYRCNHLSEYYGVAEGLPRK